MRSLPLLAALAAALSFSTGALAQTASTPVATVESASSAVPPATDVDSAAADAFTVHHLPVAFDGIVTRRLNATPDVFETYSTLARAQLTQANVSLDHDQFVVVADRNPNVQAAFVFVMGPGGVLPVGATPVSTGRSGQKDHFYTPVGVFANTVENPSFRAQGTKNSNGFRGYGRKGMRIWDFGWQTADKAWGKREPREIRFQMHATDPDLAEPKLGHPASQGCVRVSAGFNEFVDHYGVLDADYLGAEAQGQHLWVLPKERVATGLAGRYLVVVDSGVTERPEWDAQVRK